MGIIKVNGKLYSSGNVAASNINYNNANTQLQTTTVQAAIDKIYTKLTTETNVNVNNNALNIENLQNTKAGIIGNNMIYLKYENGFYYIGHDDSFTPVS